MSALTTFAIDRYQTLYSHNAELVAYGVISRMLEAFYDTRIIYGKKFFSLIFAQNIGVVLYAGPHYTREYTVLYTLKYA